ncbi:MAG: endonuclease domain-containing protein, partial [Proteobacteria bacterium]|nr:endonuclease domain-containing protein [Pseudomonadota bacterium]MBU4083005.1 endonuclease domain-containing protein [Pseudomonadota bacterium]MBU4108762.1 endonuclease domain-containing protein [Pseudomonadota bacterium]
KLFPWKPPCGCFLASPSRPNYLPHANILHHLEVSFKVAYLYIQTVYMNRLNIRVLRFLNTDVYENLYAVCERILAELKGELTTPGPS